MNIEHRVRMINANAEPCDCTMCIEVRRRDETIQLMLTAFRTIATLGGNLPDERLMDRTGPNDAAHRGMMYCTARQVARATLAALEAGSDPRHC